jgi:CheY-like chemotaxis protein
MKAEGRKRILHVCRREVLRPIRDEVLKLSGYDVDSTLSPQEALDMFRQAEYALALIDVEGIDGIEMAETACSNVKTLHPGQMVAFVCNWRVAQLTDCPDHILRTEFDPAAFVAGIHKILSVD